ncbi:LacI family transcriptional regulator [Parapusillimonas sp. SGNA-6]|uniref:LacI family DNA-binding transcriptional regulator n=1 Tax=Parapedobacter sp. SGR-10 TaxID=2710879 RepID=UPI0013D010F4|nr:LacI family DNA-binding transcriptional regulator [Parapedobacter sp. SGR-10]NGF57428.1 LacI family transcriptional regulator [Parapedobacter sp. SGR-10]NGM89359.1 LacI family transcriptional regulator [Parapusillimonas sp. SGNA-6]
MKQQVGIKDIARILNISVSTVSRALRDAYDVSPETRKKVTALAEELNFTPNKNAAALASGSTKNIGVVIPFITNYYFSTVISGIQEEAYNKGYNIILFVTNDDVDREKILLKNIATTSLDGLLISISSNSDMQDHFEQLMQRGLPIVFFDRVPHEIHASKVMQSDFDGSFMATNHLIEKGYQKIAHIAGPKELNFTQERLKGYLAALEKAKLPQKEEYIIFSGFSQGHGYTDTLALLSLTDAPDAIFAVNDRKAVGAIQALKANNIQVGVDVGVVGFTNDPIATVIEPNLTTVEEPAFEIGQQSCNLLIKHIKNKDHEPRDIVLPGKLIVRQSVVFSENK